MSPIPKAYTASRLYDGFHIHEGVSLLVDGCRVVGTMRSEDLQGQFIEENLGNGTIVPGFVDLQVNGGGGVMFNDAPSVKSLKIISQAHAKLGSARILPTLISDTHEKNQLAVEAVVAAIDQNVSGIAGLHLEGPHLSIARKGAHEASLIRKMNETDVRFLCESVSRLPCLKVTLAPESVSLSQIRRLADAGIIVSLGHSDATFNTSNRAIEAGVTCVTHLYNAMSSLQSREPGLVGAALQNGSVDAGLIADGIHVDFAAVRIAMRAKLKPGVIFLVSDAMATAGSSIQEFILNGRVIRREAGRLTLADGTLAGADLDLGSAIRNMVVHADTTLDESLAMATQYPAKLIGDFNENSFFDPGSSADFNYLSDELQLCGVWNRGQPLHEPH